MPDPMTQSAAKIAGHAIRPMTVALPIILLAATFVLDVDADRHTRGSDG